MNLSLKSLLVLCLASPAIGVASTHGNTPGDARTKVAATGGSIAIPVTSAQTDLGDDPENGYSGAPQLDWKFFGNQTRIITKNSHNYLQHRNTLGIDHKFYLLQSKSFAYPPPATIDSVIEARPTLPVIQFAALGKINRTKEDGERPLSHDRLKLEAFQSHYPNLILGGGQTAEVDGDFDWLYSQYYGRLPVGPGGRSFPFAYLDFIESNLKRSGMPYMMLQYNQSWGTHYVANERAMSLGGPQLFYRGTASIVHNLVTARSAARQYPHPFVVQFSGQPNLEISNVNQVVEQEATPTYTIKQSAFGLNYSKSYALNRQALYLSWLNGARSFNWETGEFINTADRSFPSPLGTFTKKAAELISRVGPTGPVQTPIAIISEFSNTWQPPKILGNKTISWSIAGDTPYATGDYQLHGLKDLFYRNYLQCERIHSASMGEDHALAATPYGSSTDFLLSDVRPAALQRYGLLIWGGIPPESPSMVREKLLHHISENKGRVVLFGATARNMFPEWFDAGPSTLVKAGAVCSYSGNDLKESSDFKLERMRADLDTAALSMKVLATVNDMPLVVECMGGLIIVLSDYGTNHTEHVSPQSTRWKDDQLITAIPHQLLKHTSHLLHDEASKQILFSAGNDQLHYVVTRPKPGEYLVGIFNDKLTSEPFALTSRIGRITSLDEIPLDDDQQALKAAAGGAAYAPPGMRRSMKHPLDYGVSDASHIEGRDFRLFRIRLVEEGVRSVASIQFPKRPTGRVLAVAGLGHIRSDLQGIPSFFQWFDGIKVEARDLISTEDAAIQEQAHWLDRRGVRMLVTGDGIDEATALLALAKLSLMERAAKDLVISSPSDVVRTEAARHGINLLDPAAVKRVSSQGQRFDAAASRNILDLHYKHEEELFQDLRHFESGDVVTGLRGKQTPGELRPPLDVKGDVSDDFLYVGPCVENLTTLLSRDETGFRKFKGVKIDSSYLLIKTSGELAKDAASLKRMGIEVIVDLRRDQMHHDKIAFYPHIPNYEAGIEVYRKIVNKMPALGAHDLILAIQDVGGMRNQSKYIAQRDTTWNLFADLAQARNIKLHLIFTPGLAFSPAAGFSKSNVFVIKGSKGTPSPFKLVCNHVSTGRGDRTIHDDDGGMITSGASE